MNNLICIDTTVDRIAVYQPKLATCIRAAREAGEELVESYLLACGKENATGESVVWYLEHAEQEMELPYSALLLLHEFYTR
jgi:hypothetical protein